MLKEFKDFAVKGNVIDLAVGVIIGGAVGEIVTSLVNDMIMPLIGLLIGKVDFTNLYFSLDGVKYPSLLAAQEAGAATVNYGIFINTIIEFLIITFSIYIVIRQLNRFKKKEEVVEAAPTTKECPYCHKNIPEEDTKLSHELLNKAVQGDTNAAYYILSNLDRKNVVQAIRERNNERKAQAKQAKQELDATKGEDRKSVV